LYDVPDLAQYRKCGAENLPNLEVIGPKMPHTFHLLQGYEQFSNMQGPPVALTSTSSTGVLPPKLR
jgi:hypothetical protein